jgi:hypothetical protein
VALLYLQSFILSGGKFLLLLIYGPQNRKWKYQQDGQEGFLLLAIIRYCFFYAQIILFVPPHKSRNFVPSENNPVNPANPSIRGYFCGDGNSLQ